MQAVKAGARQRTCRAGTVFEFGTSKQIVCFPDLSGPRPSASREDVSAAMPDRAPVIGIRPASATGEEAHSFLPREGDQIGPPPGNTLATLKNVPKMTPSSSSPALAFRPTPRRKSLIEWNDPSRQAHVLDWRHRAHEFGLDVEEREPEDAEGHTVEPRRLLEDEEPEAFAAQPIPEEGDVEEQDEDDAAPAAAVGREDVDLVRLYLQHIGKRKLLKAHQEVEIGTRIENAQREVLSALADIPAAMQTMMALAERIRTKGDPAAELILLPEGGELREDQIEPVLRAFKRIGRLRTTIDGLVQRLANPRLGAKTRAALEADIDATRRKIITELESQPIRPALIAS